MNWGDATTLIGLYIGAFAFGWAAGFSYLTFRKVAESAT